MPKGVLRVGVALAAVEAGVENVLDVPRGGSDSAPLGLGRASVSELGRGRLVVPDGSERRPGVSTEQPIR